MGILNNELHLGRLVWNRLRSVKDPPAGKRVSRPAPRGKGITRDKPHPHIVDDAFWDASRARQDSLARRKGPKIAGDLKGPLPCRAFAATSISFRTSSRAASAAATSTAPAAAPTDATTAPTPSGRDPANWSRPSANFRAHSRQERSAPLPKKNFTDEQIAFALRQAEAGTTVGVICRKMSVAEATFYRREKVCAGMGGEPSCAIGSRTMASEIRRLKQLEE